MTGHDFIVIPLCGKHGAQEHVVARKESTESFEQFLERITKELLHEWNGTDGKPILTHVEVSTTYDPRAFLRHMRALS